MRQRSSFSIFMIIIIMVITIFLVGIYHYIPSGAENTFGAPSQRLSGWERFRYGAELIWHVNDLIIPLNNKNGEIIFQIEPGEDAYQVSIRLEQASLIKSARSFQVFLAWSGKDTNLLPGIYHLSPSIPAITIAEMLQSVGETDTSITVLPGWRIEEIAASLATSGLSITADGFISAAYGFNPYPDLIPKSKSCEGYLFPGNYSLPRTTNAKELITRLVQEFQEQITPDYQAVLTSRGLTLHEAVTLASIIQREAVIESEMALIASVFYNRLEIGMILQTDPTIQYALGFDIIKDNWWKSPLGYTDLQFDSPYNTYLYPGLPPGPISNPGLEALAAVAYPENTPFYYFQAKCDGSGYHNFAETLEQHLENNCP